MSSCVEDRAGPTMRRAIVVVFISYIGIGIGESEWLYTQLEREPKMRQARSSPLDGAGRRAFMVVIFQKDLLVCSFSGDPSGYGRNETGSGRMPHYPTEPLRGPHIAFSPE
jgi:hypothetical protein